MIVIFHYSAVFSIELDEMGEVGSTVRSSLQMPQTDHPANVELQEIELSKSTVAVV